MPRSHSMKRTTLGLAMLGAMLLATGCDTGSSTPTVPPDDAKAQNKSMMDAMGKQNAPDGAAHSKKPSS
jgi:uncharacterized lipoprotein YajG